MPRRKSLFIPGVPHHSNPIPHGAMVGNMVYSSAISGADPETGDLPEDAESQVHNTFKNIRLLMTEAGGTIDDIVQFSVSLRDESARKALNEAWVEMFPDENNRPARHTQSAQINPRYFVQIEIVGVLETV